MSRVLSSSLHPPFDDYLHKIAAYSSEDLDILFSPEFRETVRGFEHMSAHRKVARENPGLPPLPAGLPGRSCRLPSGRHAGEGGPHEHGLFPGSPGPLAGRRDGDLCPVHSHGLQVEGHADQAAVSQGAGTLDSAGHSRTAQRGASIRPWSFWLQKSLPAYIETHGLKAVWKETGLFQHGAHRHPRGPARPGTQQLRAATLGAGCLRHLVAVGSRGEGDAFMNLRLVVISPCRDESRFVELTLPFRDRPGEAAGSVDHRG